MKILADLNLAVRYGIVIHTYTYKVNTEILADFNLAVIASREPPNISHRQISGYTVYVCLSVCALLVSLCMRRLGSTHYEYTMPAEFKLTSGYMAIWAKLLNMLKAPSLNSGL